MGHCSILHDHIIPTKIRLYSPNACLEQICLLHQSINQLIKRPGSIISQNCNVI
jgi:hypothetical protein